VFLSPEQEYVMERIRILSVIFLSVSFVSFAVFGTVVFVFYFLFPTVFNVELPHVSHIVRDVIAALILQSDVTPSGFLRFVLYHVHLYVFFLLELTMLYMVGCTGVLLWKEWGRKIMLWALPLGALNALLGTSVCMNLTYILPKAEWLAENPFITDVQRALFVVLLFVVLVFHGWGWGLLRDEDARTLFS